MTRFAYYIAMHTPRSDTSSFDSERDTPAASGMRKTWNDARSNFTTFINHMKRTGVGLVCAVGYFDPYVPCSFYSPELTEKQGKLGCRSPGWFSVRLQAAVHRPLVRHICYLPSGKSSRFDIYTLTS